MHVVRRLTRVLAGLSDLTLGVEIGRAMARHLFTGFWAQTLEMSGAADVEPAHPECLARAGRHCEFSFKWRP